MGKKQDGERSGKAGRGEWGRRIEETGGKTGHRGKREDGGSGEGGV